MKKQIINSIIEDCNVRLKPSKVCSGVGAFSIKPIKSGVVIFRDVAPDNTYINFNELYGLDDAVLNYLKNMCNCDENGLYLSRTVNNINISYFINHSNNPNVEHDLTLDVYKTIRDVDIDEELLCFYNKEAIVVGGKENPNIEQLFSNFAKVKNDRIYVNMNDIANLNLTSKGF